MTLRQLLMEKLPHNLVGPRGEITIYTIAKAVGYRPQSVAEWFRKDQVAILCVQKLLRIKGNDLHLSDFVPFCPDLKMVLDMVEDESKKAEAPNEY